VCQISQPDLGGAATVQCDANTQQRQIFFALRAPTGRSTLHSRSQRAQRHDLGMTFVRGKTTVGRDGSAQCGSG